MNRIHVNLERYIFIIIQFMIRCNVSNVVFSWFGLDVVLSVACLFGVQIVVFFSGVGFLPILVSHSMDFQMAQYAVSVESSVLFVNCLFPMLIH